MDGYAISLPVSASRPKVHRFPSRVAESRRHRLMSTVLSYGTAARFIFTLSSLALAIVVSALFFNRLVPLPALHRDMVGTVTVSEAMAASVAPALVRNKTIVLEGQDGAKIVGQITKMLPQASSSAIAAITSDIDNRRRQELLSIVNQTN